MYQQIKDPGSALTHFIGAVMAVAGMPILLMHASGGCADILRLAGLSVFLLSMVALYSASSAYHTFNISERSNRILKKLDHTMIYVLIAGSYTPICLSILPDQSGRPLLAVIWAIAVCGGIFTMFFVYCPKWLSSILYIAMGWACLAVMPDLVSVLSHTEFALLLGGGIMYTAGGIIYALKFRRLNSIHRNFGSHEIFHLFVLAGSICHFIFMWNAV